MKKNKTIAYLMAATLLVGGTFLGTKALFTDQEIALAELQISTGDLDIEVVDSGDWQLFRNGAEYGDGTSINDISQTGHNDRLGEDKKGQKNEKTPKGNFANNLKPGDMLTKTVTIQNKGTLIADNLSVSQIVDDQLGNGLLTLDTEGLLKNKLNPGEETTFTLIITVNNVGGEHNKEGFNSDTQENDVINIDDLVKDGWTLTATQQNPNTTGQN